MAGTRVGSVVLIVTAWPTLAPKAPGFTKIKQDRTDSDPWPTRRTGIGVAKIANCYALALKQRYPNNDEARPRALRAIPAPGQEEIRVYEEVTIRLSARRAAERDARPRSRQRPWRRRRQPQSTGVLGWRYSNRPFPSTRAARGGSTRCGRTRSRATADEAAAAARARRAPRAAVARDRRAPRAATARARAADLGLRAPVLPRREERAHPRRRARAAVLGLRAQVQPRRPERRQGLRLRGWRRGRRVAMTKLPHQERKPSGSSISRWTQVEQPCLRPRGLGGGKRAP